MLKIVEISKNSETLSIINESTKKNAVMQFLGVNNRDSNVINSCLIGVENNDIKNYALYIGMKDTRLIQMTIENFSSKSFFEHAVDYAYKNLNAYTITVFTDRPNKLLEDAGFENLGSDNNIVTYIKDREIEKDVGRVRI